jgi:hypothetical protein
MSNPNDPISREATDSSKLERQGDEIRADMDRTLDALERKFSPGQLLDQSMEYLRKNGANLANQVGDAVRRHPMPALLTCAGVVWLGTSLAQARSPRQSRPESNDPEPNAEADVPAAGGVVERARASAERAKGRVNAAANVIQDRTSELGGNFGAAVTDHPLAFGALAIAVGAVLGAAIPLSETEKRKIGPVRDRALAKAEEIGVRTYERVKESLSATKAGSAEGSGAT